MLKYEELLKEIRSCTLCSGDLPLGPRPIVQLRPNARILISGQAPGIRVHQSGKPFDDPSGKRLREWLGVTPEQFYNPELFAIVPMGFCYPGTGKSGDLPPRPECGSTWREKVLSELPKIKLNIVLGKYAQNGHFPEFKGTLTELVKSWKTFWPQMLPLPHPSPRNNIWLRRNPWFEEEILPELKTRILELTSS